MNNKLPVYLDNQATTPLEPLVLEAMMPYLTTHFGNPHSSTHIYGYKAHETIEEARAQIAKLINATPKEIYFTSGATESNNLVLKGLMEYYGKEGKNHFIVSAIEHKCIMSSAHYLETKGFECTFLPVDSNGIINLRQLEQSIKPNTALVSIIAVNNEIGVIQPLQEIAELCLKHNVIFHSDAAQAIGKIDIDVEKLPIGLLSLSGHKIYGPKGIGAVYINKKAKRIRLVPQIHGGGQERGLRSGTFAPFLCVGMGKACELLSLTMHSENQKIQQLHDYFWNLLNTNLSHIHLNGHPTQRVPHNLNISFAGVEGESLILSLADTVALSSGSACSSHSLESSYVLKALNISADLAHGSIRFGIGKFNTKEELTTVANAIIKVVTKLRAMSPVWEMIEQGVDLNTIDWTEK